MLRLYIIGSITLLILHITSYIAHHSCDTVFKSTFFIRHHIFLHAFVVITRVTYDIYDTELCVCYKIYSQQMFQMQVEDL